MADKEKNIFVPINKKDIKVTWDDVKGLKEAKKALMQAVVLPQARPEFFTGPRKAMKGILLYGPPGTGKTFIAKAIAAKSDSAFLSISSADILSKWVGEGAKNVKRLFDAARENSPCTIFIDEIDSMCKKRGEKTSESLGQIKTEFLAQMDGIGSDKDRVFVLGATNLPWALDDALLRRFQKRIYIPLPDDKARAGIISSNLGERDALP
jgi:vacuolar protein-sorting-associated protein 4